MIGSRYSVLLLACLTFASPAWAEAKGAKEDKPAPTAGDAPALNACGCYQDPAGKCHCIRKSKCGCDGECEPAGCVEKRRKEEEKETQQELKREQEAEKRKESHASDGKSPDGAKKTAAKRTRPDAGHQ